MKQNTFIVPIIRSDNIGSFIESVYKYTPDNFDLIVIDQTINDEAYLKYHDRTNLWVKSRRNLGFSKAMNTGIRLAQTPYISLYNDDVIFMNKRWWQGIVDTFATDPRIVAVNPMSPREGAFGYGLQTENTDTWIPPKGFVRDGDFVVPDLGEGKGMLFKENFSEEEYDWLLNSHPRWSKDTMCDGVCMWGTTFTREGLDHVGPLDERFYPGGSEDYDMCGRAYSCAWPISRDSCDETQHKRMVSTTKSWVWHKWNTSRNYQGQFPNSSREPWAHLDQLWPIGFDIWGHGKKEDGSRKPYKRVPEVFIDEL
jgi:GT2 family glycosyltransferase